MKRLMILFVFFSSFSVFSQDISPTPSVAGNDGASCERADWDCELCPHPACGPHCLYGP